MRAEGRKAIYAKSASEKAQMLVLFKMQNKTETQVRFEL